MIRDNVFLIVYEVNAVTGDVFYFVKCVFYMLHVFNEAGNGESCRKRGESAGTPQGRAPKHRVEGHVVPAV